MSNLPGIEALMRWNFPELPKDARIFSQLDDNGVCQVTIYYRLTPDSEKKRIDMAIELHLFGHGLATDFFDVQKYEKFVNARPRYSTI